jgi:hypothetical protein
MAGLVSEDTSTECVWSHDTGYLIYVDRGAAESATISCRLELSADLAPLAQR